MNAPTIYIIAGEASGDFLGAELMRSLRARNADITFHGIGGYHMQQAGLISFFPMEELSLMGFAEILPHALKLKKRIKQTEADIRAKNPDMILTIDSPGFTFRIAKALQDHPAKKLHYVAPTVWAYKPERAAKTAALFDHLLCLLPFEPPYFMQEGLDTTFIGHPVIQRWRDAPGDGAAFRARHDIAENTLLLGMMPGSRKGELSKHMPLFLRIAALLHLVYRNVEVVIPTSGHLRPAIERACARWPMKVHITSDIAEKHDAFCACNVALAKSGTVTLDAAMAKLPMVTTYLVHPISAMIARRLIKTPFFNLVNILENKEIIPEFIQERARTKLLAPALEELINDEHKRAAQIEASYHALLKIGLKQEQSPSDLAADTVLKML